MVYTSDLSMVAGTFPAVPGVYWTVTVTRVKDFAATFNTDADLSDGETLTATVHFASDASAAPEQAFVELVTVEVMEAFGLSAQAAEDATYSAGEVAEFTASLLNLSGTSRQVELTMSIPPSTTLDGVSAGGLSEDGDDSVVIRTTVQPYATAGAKQYTLSLILGTELTSGSEVMSTMDLKDLGTGDTVTMESTIGIAYDVYLPLLMRESS